jgi:hypothetical protein
MLRALLTVAVVGALAGCSFKLAAPPPPPSEWPPRPLPHGTMQEFCRPYFTPPFLDTAAVLLLGSLAYLERNSAGGKASIILIGASLPVGVSAVYGYGSAVACRRYQRWVLTPP